jgi:hypothetical protein
MKNYQDNSDDIDIIIKFAISIEFSDNENYNKLDENLISFFNSLLSQEKDLHTQKISELAKFCLERPNDKDIKSKIFLENLELSFLDTQPTTKEQELKKQALKDLLRVGIYLGIAVSSGATFATITPITIGSAIHCVLTDPHRWCNVVKEYFNICEKICIELGFNDLAKRCSKLSSYWEKPSKVLKEISESYKDLTNRSNKEKDLANTPITLITQTNNKDTIIPKSKSTFIKLISKNKSTFTKLIEEKLNSSKNVLRNL